MHQVVARPFAVLALERAGTFLLPMTVSSAVLAKPLGVGGRGDVGRDSDDATGVAHGLVDVCQNTNVMSCGHLMAGYFVADKDSSAHHDQLGLSSTSDGDTQAPLVDDETWRRVLHRIGDDQVRSSALGGVDGGNTDHLSVFAR